MDVASLVEDEAVRERACFEADLRAPLGIARLPPTAALDSPDPARAGPITTRAPEAASGASRTPAA
mgnify:CR=1 FL=1